MTQMDEQFRKRQICSRIIRKHNRLDLCLIGHLLSTWHGVKMGRRKFRRISKSRNFVVKIFVVLIRRNSVREKIQIIIQLLNYQKEILRTGFILTRKSSQKD